MDDLLFADAHALARVIRERQVSAAEVIDAHLAQIARHNPALNAIITLDEEGARQRARAADEALARGGAWGPLHGVPLTLKDVHDTAGIRSTMGEARFAGRVPAEDSPVAARLKAAGCILIGKTNAEMFPDNPFGPARSPWDLGRSPGLSSSGAAAALAAGMTPLDIGSDSAGSIIEPAHASGVFGMRPTEHRVPQGALPEDPLRLWRVLRVFGPMARSVADLRLALRIIAGPDTGDVEVPPLPWRDVAGLRLEDLRLAWAPAFPGAPVAAGIQSAIEGLAVRLARRGARVKHALPEVDLQEQNQIMRGLADAIDSAAGTPLQDYLDLLHRRDKLIAKWESFFRDRDALLCPAAQVTALPLGQSEIVVDGQLVPDETRDTPGQLSAASGQPAVVVPLARDRDGLPIGLQLIGRRWDDERLLRIAELVAEEAGGFTRPPGYG